MPPNASKTKRPLSPHLQVYKPQITSVLSIMHRISGAFLSLGAFVFVMWLYSMTKITMPCCKASVWSDNIVLKLLVPLWIFALFFHFLNGLRHLAWDAGLGFDMRSVRASGYAVVIGSVICTLFTCIFLMK